MRISRKMNKDRAIIILDRCIENLLYLLIFFIPISKAAISIIFGIAMFLFIIKKILNPDFRFAKNHAHLFLALFFGFCALSLFNSGIYLQKGLRALFGKWLEYIFIFILAEDTLNTRQRLKNAVVIFLSISGLVAVDGIYQKFSGVDFFRGRHLVDARPTAGFENQNSLAAYLVPGLILATTLLFYRELKAKYKYVLIFLSVSLGVALILTFTRSAWLSFIAGSVFWIFLSRNFKKGLIPMAIFIIILVSVPALRGRAMVTFKPGWDSDRFALMHTAWGMIKDSPFLGKGLGTFMDYFRQYATIEGVYYAHNCYLQIWAEAGIFSLLSFLLFTGTILIRGIKKFARHPDYLLLGMLCIFFALMVNIFFDNHLYSLQLKALFWFILGLTCAATRLSIDVTK